MQKFSLLQSVQGGPFSNSSRMIDIDIPSGLLVDMSQSFIQLETSIAPNVAVFTKGISNLIVQNSAVPSIAPLNVDLIKNVSLYSSTKGKLEDVRRVNINSHNLQEFTKSTAEKMSSVSGLDQYTPFSNQVQLSPYIEAHKVGNIVSSYRHNFLRIPLSQLLQLGAFDAFDTEKLGTCRIHLELDNLDSYVLALKNNVLIPETLGPQKTSGDAGIASGYSVQMKKVYDSEEMIPFFVGQFVLVKAQEYDVNNQAVGNPTYKEVIITELSLNSSTGILTIYFDSQFAPTQGNTFNDIVVTQYEPAQAPSSLGTFNVLTAQLGLCTIEGAPASAYPTQMDYLTFTTEEYNAGNQAFMNKIFELEPECVNVFIMQNNPAIASNLLSVNTGINSYRLRIDGNDVVDRDIFVNKQYQGNPYGVDNLHYELINRTFKNASFPLKSLECASISRTDDAQALRFVKDTNQILLICCPTPMTTDTKKFQVNIEAKSGQTISNVILFKHVLRSIKL
jgi:hypothetical protein